MLGAKLNKTKHLKIKALMVAELFKSVRRLKRQKGC